MGMYEVGVQIIRKVYSESYFEKGKTDALQTTALNLMYEGVDLSVISKVTGYDRDFLERLKNDKTDDKDAKNPEQHSLE